MVQETGGWLSQTFNVRKKSYGKMLSRLYERISQILENYKEADGGIKVAPQNGVEGSGVRRTGRKVLVTLEIVGRISGQVFAFPLVMLVSDAERFFVSMLGEGANWVRNSRAVDGKATLRHGRVEQVLLEDVPIAVMSALVLLAVSLVTMVLLVAIGGQRETAQEGFDRLAQNRVTGLLMPLDYLSALGAVL